MYLSNRDIKYAIDCGKLIVEPRPEDWQLGYDETSIDLHLDAVKFAKVWDIAKLKRDHLVSGVKHPELNLGAFDWTQFSDTYLAPVPDEADHTPAGEPEQRVFRRGKHIILRPLGFLLWTTKEKVGTPKASPEFIAFVNAKSTRARTGLMVHFTAPTIHSGWAGKITLEITNLGPFDFVLEEDAIIAQLTVATISSKPDLTMKKGQSKTEGQIDPSGSKTTKRGKGKK